MEQPIFQTDAGKSLAGGRQEERWTELCLDDQSRLDVGYNAALPSGQSVSHVVRMRDLRTFLKLLCGAPCSALRRLIEFEILIHFN